MTDDETVYMNKTNYDPNRTNYDDNIDHALEAAAKQDVNQKRRASAYGL